MPGLFGGDGGPVSDSYDVITIRPDAAFSMN
jgi:hypothetical protein